MSGPDDHYPLWSVRVCLDPFFDVTFETHGDGNRPPILLSDSLLRLDQSADIYVPPPFKITMKIGIEKEEEKRERGGGRGREARCSLFYGDWVIGLIKEIQLSRSLSLSLSLPLLFSLKIELLKPLVKPHSLYVFGSQRITRRDLLFVSSSIWLTDEANCVWVHVCVLRKQLIGGFCLFTSSSSFDLLRLSSSSSSTWIEYILAVVVVKEGFTNNYPLSLFLSSLVSPFMRGARVHFFIFFASLIFMIVLIILTGAGGNNNHWLNGFFFDDEGGRGDIYI